MPEPLYVVLNTCEVSQLGPTVVQVTPLGRADAQRLADRHTLAAAAGRSCCRYELRRLAPVTTAEEDLTDRLAGALADALGHFRLRADLPGETYVVVDRITPRSVDAWRSVYAEWADRVAPEGREADRG